MTLRGVRDIIRDTILIIQNLAAIGSRRRFYGEYIATTMGCVNDKDLRSNVATDTNTITASTMLRADQIVILGDSVFLPTKTEDGEYQVLEINIDDKKINVHRGLANRAIRTGLS
ncbi:unnamed protein product [Phytophthora lilii]|uniref:Unnamed protein product n=1 Tax=Phytophthora lilii TaxID=2077276 RepID=A0A9W6WR78_9STRA|nr:unnamed protein product [Phytophthora lilii]